MFEGTDGVGKTRTAKWTARLLRAPLVHYGPPPEDPDPLEIYVSPVFELLGEYDHVVLDRSPFGATIWAQLGCHPPTMNEDFHGSLCRFFAVWDGWMNVLVRPEAAIMAELARRRESSPVTLEDSLRAQDLYIDLVLDRSILFVPVALFTSSYYHRLIGEVPPQWK